MDIMMMGKNPNYLGSWDLEEQPNRQVTLQIAQIRDEEVVTSSKSETCTVCYWADKGWKPMILNVTNKKTLCRLFKTKDTDKLCGQRVTIGIEKVRAFGATHDALRICKQLPPKVQEPPVPCEQCGGAIAPYGSMTSAQVAAYSRQKCGRALCVSCASGGSPLTSRLPTPSAKVGKG